MTDDDRRELVRVTGSKSSPFSGRLEAGNGRTCDQMAWLLYDQRRK